MRNRLPAAITAAALMLLGSLLYGQNAGDRLKPATRQSDLGMVVSATDLFLDLESYQGGLGFKVGTDKWTYRLGLDMMVRDLFNPYSLSLSLALEKHLLPGAVSPYLGGYLKAGISSLKDEIDSANWQRTTVFPLSTGALLGIELFVFDFLSLFVEYDLAATFSTTVTTTSVGGVKDSQNSYDFALDLGLGNQSRLGIVIYFARRPARKAASKS